MAEALAYVHARDIRHCDLKPGNVLLDARGRPLLADFGQAHLSDDVSPALGTFFYMAPEQADLAPQAPSARWDVYGLGALLYALLTGKPPREESSLRAELENTEKLSHRLRRYREAVRKAPPPREHRKVRGVDRVLAEIIERCLAVDPAERYKDAEEVLAALRRRNRQRQQRPLLVFGLLAPLVLLLAGAGLSFLTGNAALGDAQHSLTEQLLKSDLNTARLVASAVSTKLHNRIERVEQVAHAEGLAAAITQKPRGKLLELLESRHRDDSTMYRWGIADASGTIIALYPKKDTDHEVLDKNFSHRDWFHGGGNKPKSPHGLFRIIKETHISQMYVPKGEQDKRVIVISTPIYRDREKGREPVGLLLGIVDMDVMHNWLEETTGDRARVVLFNKDGHCLFHEGKREAPKPGQEDYVPPEFLSKSRRLTQFLQQRLEDTEVDYRDPVDGRRYVAAYAPCDPQDSKVNSTPVRWGVLVQHERETALKPVEYLKGRMLWWGIVASLVLGLLVSGLWAYLLWLLRRGKGLTHG